MEIWTNMIISFLRRLVINLNSKYKKKFGFPFIFAVKNKTKLEILSSFRKRISYNTNVEFEEAKTQVKKIAILRLNEINKK